MILFWIENGGHWPYFVSMHVMSSISSCSPPHCFSRRSSSPRRRQWLTTRLTSWSSWKRQTKHFNWPHKRWTSSPASEDAKCSKPTFLLMTTRGHKGQRTFLTSLSSVTHFRSCWINHRVHCVPFNNSKCQKGGSSRICFTSQLASKHQHGVGDNAQLEAS